MSYPMVLYGPESEIFNTYSAVTPAPGNNGVGGPVAQRYPYPLGQVLILGDGRKFRFAVVASGSALVTGNVIVGPVATASQQNLTAAAGTVGDRLATMTTGASSAVNTFAEGFLVVSVTPGIGQTFKIASHAVMTSGAGDTVNFAVGHAIRVATTTSSKYDLIQSQYFGALQSPATTVASAMIGVAVTAAGVSKGTWLQTHGLAGVLTSGTAIAGDRVSTGLGGAGAAGPNAAIATQPDVGLCIYAAASGAVSTVLLQIG